MKKINFYKAIHGRNGKYNFMECTGWAAILQAPDNEYIEIAIHRDNEKSYWHTTEILTGYALNIYGNTRADVLKQFTPDLLQKISDQLKSEYIQKAIYRLNVFLTGVE